MKVTKPDSKPVTSRPNQLPDGTMCLAVDIVKILELCPEVTVVNIFYSITQDEMDIKGMEVVHF